MDLLSILSVLNVERLNIAEVDRETRLNVRSVILGNILMCDICQLRIKKGHAFLPFIPGGYGPIKNKSREHRYPGIMHVSHLSSSDWLSKDMSDAFEHLESPV